MDKKKIIQLAEKELKKIENNTDKYIPIIYRLGFKDGFVEAAKQVNVALGNVSNSCHCVINEDENIVQLYSTIEKAEIGLAEFTKSHPDSIFCIDEISIN